MATCELEAPALVRGASFPGGSARQFRVQIYCPASKSWQRHATFVRQEQADACCRGLIELGQQARIIATNCVAVGA